MRGVMLLPPDFLLTALPVLSLKHLWDNRGWMFWGWLGQAEQERRKSWSCSREEQGTACELGLGGDHGFDS